MPRVSRRVKALAHLEMTRPYTMFHAGLVAVAGAELASGGQGAPWRVALAGVVTICGWEAGLYAGDYYDRELDAQSKPFRPVPSGRVSPREAFLTMVGLILSGYVCALALGPGNLALAILTTVLGISYSKTFKAKALLGNFDRGVLGVCAALFGSLAVGTPAHGTVLLLLVVVFLHDSASNLVGTIRDVDGDRAAGCATVPVVYGVPRAAAISAGLALGGALAGIGLMVALAPGPLAWTLFVGALVLDASVYLGLVSERSVLNRARALRAHKYLVVERLLLFNGFIAVYAPSSVSLILLAGTLSASVGAQVLLRDRHERQPLHGSTTHGLVQG
ncbi:MAG TPA: UbiA family prenyltransferase [Chloroflexota bacterium]|nr:UbiA family prenyltransferase [Chloroflexota bacterium]